jgi:catechol 2,3-dioxygenase-like lactoylglutathione lyase family enzyme
MVDSVEVYVMIEEIRSIPVIVSNLKEATIWYTEKLGFEVRSSDGHWVTVAPKGWPSELHLCEIEPLELGNTGILLLADDLEETCRELKKKGVEFTEEPTKKAGGTIAKLKDPDGNIFWLMPKSEYS